MKKKRLSPGDRWLVAVAVLALALWLTHLSSRIAGADPIDNALVGITGDGFLGLRVEPERRCSKYDRRDYHYPASIEQKIVNRQGGIFGPYEMREFGSIRETDIEHIVAAAEAHDSGMCARSRDERKAFARDLDNLTLASPKVNRWQKSDRDAAEWMPEYSRCWYIARIMEVKDKWDLSVDAGERDALQTWILKCMKHFEMETAQ